MCTPFPSSKLFTSVSYFRIALDRIRIRIPDPHGLFHFTYSPHRESPVILCDRTDTYESQQKNSHSAMRVGKGRVLGTTYQTFPDSVGFWFSCCRLLSSDGVV